MSTDAIQYIPLKHRALIALSGEDLRAFLQGIVTNDVDKITEEQAIWSALLTPQGKFLHEFFMAQYEDRILVEAEAARLGDLLRRFKLYRLRSKVQLEDVSAQWQVFVLFGDKLWDALPIAGNPGQSIRLGDGFLLVDPRDNKIGARLYWPTGQELSLEGVTFEEGKEVDYDRQRISLALPDGSRDMKVEGSVLLENGFEELGGVDFNKGCFIGQEVTARTKYRGLVKKRLIPLKVDGDLPETGESVMHDNRVVGEIRSVVSDRVLALIRVNALNGGSLVAGNSVLVPVLPEWMKSSLN